MSSSRVGALRGFCSSINILGPPMKEEVKERFVQEFPHRCPYCDQPVSYDQLDLKAGENEIQCFSCKKTYIKVVAPSFPEDGHKSGRPKGRDLR